MPGLRLALGFMVVIASACLLRPEWGGQRIRTTLAPASPAWCTLVPPLGLVVVGSVYAGLATPTEAAALGGFASLGLAAWNRMLSLTMLVDVVLITTPVGMNLFVVHNTRKGGGSMNDVIIGSLPSLGVLLALLLLLPLFPGWQRWLPSVVG